MSTDKKTHKLTDEQFIEAFRASEGNFSQTARYIEERFNISYTKQAARERALGNPQEFEALFSIMDNECSTSLMRFACDESNEVKLRGRFYAQVMNQLARRERMKILAAKKKPEPESQPEPDEYFDINGYKFYFNRETGETPEQM